MLGHIHKHQAWTRDGQIIAYPGSIGRLHYGEEGAKGWLLWDVDADRAAFEFVETPARRMLDLTFTGRPDMEALRASAQEVRGAFVRVRWQIAEEERHSVDRSEIERVLADAAELKLEGRVVPLMRTRAAGISAVPTLTDKLRRWAQLAHVDGEPLAERLTWLQAMQAEAIVQTIVSDVATAAGQGGDMHSEQQRPAQIEADLFGE
ncbi:MAG TPA: hypothetical protein VFP68_06765 [Burkholderiaceae bacterium]|nr:hypothetical protein [Burkholderiaceae bacterium]